MQIIMMDEPVSLCALTSQSNNASSSSLTTAIFIVSFIQRCEAGKCLVTAQLGLWFKFKVLRSRDVATNPSKYIWILVFMSRAHKGTRHTSCCWLTCAAAALQTNHLDTESVAWLESFLAGGS